jgi:virulence-associated protein VapD
LTKHYGNDHTKPYNEVRTILQELGFIGIQGNLYLSKNEKNDLTTVYKVTEPPSA